MRKLRLAIAVLGTLAVALPSIASTNTVKKRYHHPIDTRAKYRMHRHGPHEGGPNHDGRANPHHHMILD
jgi:hypothetical protein